MATRKGLADRSVILAIISEIVDVGDFINTVVKNACGKKPVAIHILVNTARNIRQYVVNVPGKMDRNKLQPVKTTKYRRKEYAIIVQACTEEDIPPAWLNDPPDYTPVFQPLSETTSGEEANEDTDLRETHQSDTKYSNIQGDENQSPSRRITASGPQPGNLESQQELLAPDNSEDGSHTSSFDSQITGVREQDLAQKQPEADLYPDNGQHLQNPAIVQGSLLAGPFHIPHSPKGSNADRESVQNKPASLPSFDVKTASTAVQRDLELQQSPVHIDKEQLQADVKGSTDTLVDTSSTSTGVQTESCTIEVRGFQTKTSDETFQLYFENNLKSGGGDVRGILRRNDVIYVTFSTHEEVKRVLERSHTVEGQKLQVTLQIQEPCYKNIFLLSNLKNTTSKRSLKNYLEAKTRCDVMGIIYGEQPGKALTTFDNGSQPDLHKLRQRCKEDSLDGRYLETSTVPISDTILVQGISPQTSEDTISLYFGGRRCGHEEELEVTVTMQRDDGLCLVQFKNHKAVEGVLSKNEHRIGDIVVSVSLYIESLGIGRTEDDKPWYQQPEAFTMESLDKHICLFLRKSVEEQNLKKELAACNAEITWPSDDTAALKCSLTDETPDAVQKAKTWRADIEVCFTKFLEQFKVEYVTCLSQIWDDVCFKVKTISTEVVIFITDTAPKMVIVGRIEDVRQIVNEIKTLVEEAEDEYNRKEQEVTETVTSLQPIKLRLLSTLGWHSQMMKDCKDLVVTIDLMQNQITFKGQVKDISSCLLQMLEKIESFRFNPEESRLSEIQLLFLVQAEVKDTIMNKMRQNHQVGEWETEPRMIILSTSEEAAQAVAALIQKVIVEHTEHLGPESASLLTSEKWSELKKSIHSSHGNLVLIRSDLESHTLTVVATHDIAFGIREQIQDFIAQNSIHCSVIKIPRPIFRFLIMHRVSDIKSTAESLAKYNGKLEYEEDKPQITVHGYKKEMEETVKALTKFAKNVVNRKYTMRRTGIEKYIHYDKITAAIAETEKSDRCVIELEYNETDGISVARGSSEASSAAVVSSVEALSGVSIFASCIDGSGRRIEVVTADLTTMKVDVIVNAANNQLDHAGGLAKAISDKGGPDIQRESREYIANHKKVQAGDAVPSGPGRLPCKMVVHAVGPIWNGGYQREKEYLKSAVISSMECADRKGFKSIAIPGLSAGIFGYPIGQATRHIVEAVKTFFTLESPNSGLTNVFLADLNQECVKDFVVALQDIYSDKVILSAKDTVTAMGPPVIASPKPQRVMSNEEMSKDALNITLVKGEIAKQMAGVIVNSTSKDLDLAIGAVSKSILEIGGPSLQSELKTNYPRGIEYGDIAVSSGGDLFCQEVYHICLPSWDNAESNQTNCTDLLKKLVHECLNNALDEGYTSIAFPALGTGNLGYPEYVVAQTMYTAVRDFHKRKGLLNQVFFVVYYGNGNAVKAFEKCEKLTDTGESFEKSGLACQQPRFPVQEDAEIAASSLAHITAAGDLFSVNLVTGEINKQTTDVIVNSVGQNLDLNYGTVAKCVLKSGGYGLQRELRTNYPDGIQPGEIAVTTGGKLQCKQVYHICLPNWSEYLHPQFLDDRIQNCLRMASDAGYKSIAFPALGTGNLGYPKDVIAKTMYAAMANFQRRNESLKEVKIVIFYKDTAVFQAFEACNKQTSSVGSIVLPDVPSNKVQRTSRTHTDGRVVPSGSVDLYFFSDEMASINKGIRKLEEKCDKELNTREVTNFSIKRLTQEQIRAVKESCDVDLLVGTGNDRIEITGLAADVGNAMLKVTTYLHDIEIEEAETERAKLLSRSVQWCYIENDSVKMFNAKQNSNIEMAFGSKNTNCKVNLPEGELVIDFSSMKGQFTGKKEELNMIRRDIVKEAEDSISKPPKTWQQIPDDAVVICVDLKSTDQEFTVVSQSFLQTIGYQSATIVNVKRVQNLHLYQQYMAHKNHLEKQNPPGSQNERQLWHGTSSDAIDSINMRGFNRSYCGKNATVHGQGVYFALNASFSASNTYSRPDGNGHKCMYLARVLTGIYEKGVSSMRIPPTKPGGKGMHDLCDSVVDDKTSPTMFVVFNDNQAYPEYLVTFTI